MSVFEVVRSDVDGWDVRRTGETQALSNYATKELAEEAARKQQQAENRTGSGGSDSVDIRQDVFSEGPREDLDARKTAIGAGTILIAVILLMTVVAILVVVTGVTNGS